MAWNWQQPGWPEFSSNRGRLNKAEAHFLLRTGIFVGTLEHLAASDRQKLAIDAIVAEAVTTSEIEGTGVRRFASTTLRSYRTTFWGSGWPGGIT